MIYDWYSGGYYNGIVKIMVLSQFLAVAILIKVRRVCGKSLDNGWGVIWCFKTHTPKSENKLSHYFKGSVLIYLKTLFKKFCDIFYFHRRIPRVFFRRYDTMYWLYSFIYSALRYERWTNRIFCVWYRILCLGVWISRILTNPICEDQNCYK